MNRYRLEVYVETPYYTYVDAENEEEAKNEALNRDVFIPYTGAGTDEHEWVTDGPHEFLNLAMIKEPEIELEEEGIDESKIVHKFSDFLNEKKETKKSKEQIIKEVEKDAKKVATEMFDKTKGVKFEYKKDGLPSKISFEITESDYKINYIGEKDMFIEYSKNVLNKREYKVELSFNNKSKEVSEKAKKYEIVFDIKLTPTDKIEYKDNDYFLVWEFEDKPKSIYNYVNKELKIKHTGNIKWEDGKLKIKKSFWDNKLDGDYVEKLIDEEEGIKKTKEEI